MAISTINQSGLNAPLTLTSPVLTTPNLGTPSAINLANATGLPSAALPTGSVLQVVQGTYSTQISTTSTTLISTGLTASITPKFSTSKILVLLSQNFSAYNTPNANYDTAVQFVLNRNATALYSSGGTDMYFYAPSSSNYQIALRVGLNYLDSPATTSSTTYSTTYSSYRANQTAYAQISGYLSTIILMEIAG